MALSAAFVDTWFSCDSLNLRGSTMSYTSNVWVQLFLGINDFSLCKNFKKSFFSKKMIK